MCREQSDCWGHQLFLDWKRLWLQKTENRPEPLICMVCLCTSVSAPWKHSVTEKGSHVALGALDRLESHEWNLTSALSLKTRPSRKVAPVVENPPVRAGDTAPGSGGHGNLLQYSRLENAMGREAWWATVPGVAESDMTEHTSTHAHLSIRFHEDFSFICMSSFYDFFPISIKSSKRMNSSS